MTHPRFTLGTPAGMRVSFTSLGGIILGIEVPDREGRPSNVAAAYARIEDYRGDPNYLGALIGRYANRIGAARFSLDGREYRLDANNGANHLHGGTRGFHTATWSVALESPARAVLSHRSPAGDGGYPGALEVSVTYSLSDANELRIDYHATTDAPTPVNLTQHTYFNLGGEACPDILGHEVTLYASRYTPVDAGLIPTGEVCDVSGTPFDFRTPRRIGERIDDDDPQLRHGQGYDHNYVLEIGDWRLGIGEYHPAARLHEPVSGRTMELLTTEPGLQFYSGNVLRLPSGASPAPGPRIAHRSALALEPQHFPDSPNKPHFPSTILRPGETWRSTTVYRFGVTP